MATLIAVHKSDGRLVGRCDARCYLAKEDRCNCICGGKNHGAGMDKAVENTAQMADQWVKAARDNGYDFQRTKLGDPVAQPALF